MARRFAGEGRSLALAARRLDRLETLADELRPAAEQVAVAQLDVDWAMMMTPEGRLVSLVGSAPPEDVARVEVRDPARLAFVTQTTLSVDETMETVRRLRERFPNLQDPPSDDICYATQNRQLAVKQMAADCDLMLVVGSRNSSNSVRLVEVALEHGARAGHLVDYAEEIDEAWLEGVSTVGVTSGASVPEILVRDVLAFLSERGFEDPEPVIAAEESLTFALPNEIRRDLKAAGMSDKMTHDAAAATDGVTDPLH